MVLNIQFVKRNNALINEGMVTARLVNHVVSVAVDENGNAGGNDNEKSYE